jgi:hypothetical protein
MEDDSYLVEIDDSPIAVSMIHLHEPDIALFRTEVITFNGHGANCKPIAIHESTAYPTARAADGILWVTSHLLHLHGLNWWTAQIKSVGVRSWENGSARIQAVVTVEDEQGSQEFTIELLHSGSFTIWRWPTY